MGDGVVLIADVLETNRELNSALLETDRAWRWGGLGDL
jgi:hypothetical protein